MAVISFSWQFGAGGRTVAALLAERLNYKFAEESLLTQVSQKAASLDPQGESDLVPGKYRLGFMGRFFGAPEGELQDDSLISALREAMNRIAAEGEVIFLGRGSQFLLPDDFSVVKVLLVAPEKARREFMVKEHDLSEEEARDTIASWEKNRRDFLKRISDQDPDDPSLYDLVINTERVRPELAVNALIFLVRQRSGK